MKGTSREELWPPATNGMSVEELLKLRQIAKETITHIGEIVYKRCAQDGGHKWDNDKGIRHSEGGYGGGFGRNDSGDYDDTPSVPYRVYYVRTCTRCGGGVKRDAVTPPQSPF